MRVTLQKPHRSGAQLVTENHGEHSRGGGGVGVSEGSLKVMPLCAPTEQGFTGGGGRGGLWQ